MISGRDILSFVFGVLMAIVLPFLVICIGGAVNGLSPAEQVTDWFGAEVVADEIPGTDETPEDDTTVDTETPGTEDDTTNTDNETSADDTTVTPEETD